MWPPSVGSLIETLKDNYSCLSIQYRKVILQLFQTSKSVQKKQVLDEISKLGIPPDQKVLASALKVSVNNKCCEW